MLPPDSSDDGSADDSDADPDYDPDLAHTNRLERFMQSKYNNDEEMNSEEDNLAEIRNETSSQAEEEEPSTSTQAPRKTNKDKPPPPLWTNVDAAESVREPVIWKDTLPESTVRASPIEYFKEFFDNSILDRIVDQSNLFAIQKNPNKPLNLTRNELEQYIGICFAMSIFGLHRARMYWAKE
ncbi:piggyBac transposable element-derived protein 2-like [Homalodisca vitripennis]|uniref:piggyBac transposable element-derived protein 2-like n=1 Tax=Homalodisca vitripennis TaxID=197043 RepID=UPI001EEA630C|nr:piggyBac transposable element-derived protein 2-like [Homalodisca vitripennis]